MSSAKGATVVLLVVEKSAVYIEYSRVPSTLSCGTPDFTW
jgi:hypothetical protein